MFTLFNYSRARNFVWVFCGGVSIKTISIEFFSFLSSEFCQASKITVFLLMTYVLLSRALSNNCPTVLAIKDHLLTLVCKPSFSHTPKLKLLNLHTSPSRYLTSSKLFFQHVKTLSSFSFFLLINGPLSPELKHRLTEKRERGRERERERVESYAIAKGEEKRREEKGAPLSSPPSPAAMAIYRM